MEPYRWFQMVFLCVKTHFWNMEFVCVVAAEWILPCPFRTIWVFWMRSPWTCSLTTRGTSSWPTRRWLTSWRRTTTPRGVPVFSEASKPQSSADLFIHFSDGVLVGLPEPKCLFSPRHKWRRSFRGSTQRAWRWLRTVSRNRRWKHPSFGSIWSVLSNLLASCVVFVC